MSEILAEDGFVLLKGRLKTYSGLTLNQYGVASP